MPDLLRRTKTSGYIFQMPTPTTLDGGRMVAALWPEDAVFLAALLAPMHRHPRLAALLPNAYAYLPPKRGALRLVQALLGGVQRAAAGADVVEVGAADVQKCFPSLSPEHALEHARRLGFSGWRLDVLSCLYRFWNTVPEFGGLTTGPASSCLLSELALRPLDALLSQHGLHHRYADNLYLVTAGGVPVREMFTDCMTTFNANEGLDLRLHHEKVSTYSPEHGFEQPFEALGFLFEGHEVLPHPARVERCRARVLRAADDAEARERAEGFVNYFAAGGVPRALLNTIAINLLKERERDRKRSREEETDASTAG